MKTKKSKKAENPFYQSILNFLKKKKGKSYKKREISRILGVKKSDYHLYRDALNELARSGKVARLKGGRYTIAATLQKIHGQIQITRKGFAFVTDERTGEDIFISAQNLNTALDQDIVEVQLFGVSRGKNKEGRVIDIISRAKEVFVGTYHETEYYGFVVPDNPKVYRDFFIPENETAGAKHGQKVLVELEKWDSFELNPVGKIQEVLGYPEEPGVDVSSVALDFGLPLKFSKQVENEAAKIQCQVSPQELSRRLDLRDEITFTIDPAEAKDFDDAVSLDKLNDGNYRLGVHIADVSYYVTEGSNIDKEAFRRGTSIYMVDRVIPMLPEHLSNEICSLQPHRDRLTYSCIMDVSSSGTVFNYKIQESVINSKRRFTYEEVQAIIDDENSDDPLADILREMHRLSRILRDYRIQQGSIDFETPEVRFTLDESGKPVDIIPVDRLHSHELIEEFMLLANQTVTKSVQSQSKNQKTKPFIYRVHEKPDAEKLQKFRNFLQALGHKVRIKRNLSPRDFQNTLQQIEGDKDEILIKEVALRTMMKAVYSPNNAGHFGLAFQYYTHFTSPIRRYPDLIVHRLLKEYEATVSKQRQRDLKKSLKRICEVSSERERIALEAERESIRIKQVEWISQHKDKVFEGLISGVLAFGVFVETIPYLIEGLIRIENLADDFYIYDEKTYSLIGKDTGKLLRLGDSVKVKVDHIDLERNEVDFRLVENDIASTIF